MILSSPSSSSSSSSYILVSTSRARVRSPLLVTASKLSFFAARRSSRLVLCASKTARGMAEIVDGTNDSSESSATVTAAAAASASSVASSTSSFAAFDKKPDLLSHSPTFLDLRSEEDLLSGIRKEAEAGNLPSNVAQGMEELYQNYRDAIFQSGHPKADEVVLSNMAVALDCILKDVKEPFEFSPYHKAIREPFDYYMFGQNYIRPLVDFRNSYVGNISLFSEVEEKLKQGENVVLMSNHQTEADPAVISLLLESTNPYLAANMIYVAGDRVITDPLCKPFSMGRNLLCVYSKKHMYDVPELAETKKRANTRSLKEMALLLRGGSKIIWIAPSGGRDRPDPVTEEWYPAPFDAFSADNMRRLVEHAGVPGHIYPIAVLCYNIMPPPTQVEKELGEERVMSFHGAGISVAPEIISSEVAGAAENTEEAKMVYSRALYESVNQQYNVLKSAVHAKEGLHATSPSVSLSQP